MLSLYLDRSEISKLEELALSLGFTRGHRNLPNISALIRAIVKGDLILKRPDEPSNLEDDKDRNDLRRLIARLDKWEDILNLYATKRKFQSPDLATLHRLLGAASAMMDARYMKR